MSCSCPFGWMVYCHKNSRTLPLSTKGTGRAVATTEGSPSPALPERYLLDSSSITSFYASTLVFDQKVNAISMLVVVQLTWSLPLVNSRRNLKKKDHLQCQCQWNIMARFWCLDSFLTCQLYNSMMARVLDDGDASSVIPVSNCEKQGCILSPTLFNMMFSAILMDAFNKEDPGVRYNTDGKLFNLRRLCQS